MHSTTLILVALSLAGAAGCAVASPDELYAIRMTETLSGGQEREVSGSGRVRAGVVADRCKWRRALLLAETLWDDDHASCVEREL